VVIVALVLGDAAVLVCAAGVGFGVAFVSPVVLGVMVVFAAGCVLVVVTVVVLFAQQE
jgi:hypothetical protein